MTRNYLQGHQDSHLLLHCLRFPVVFEVNNRGDDAKIVGRCVLDDLGFLQANIRIVDAACFTLGPSIVGGLEKPRLINGFWGFENPLLELLAAHPISSLLFTLPDHIIVHFEPLVEVLSKHRFLLGVPEPRLLEYRASEVVGLQRSGRMNAHQLARGSASVLVTREEPMG